MAASSPKKINNTASHVKHTESDAHSFIVTEQIFPSTQGQEDSTPEQRIVPAEPYDVYPKQGQKRLALIFNHEEFLQPSNRERSGTQVDRQSLQECFKKYNFDIEPLKDNMKKAEIQEKLKEVAERDHSDTDCLAVAVLTHGNDRGGLAAYDDWYTEEELIGSFTSNKCLSLTGKPKLFFIQACRGDKTSVAAGTINIQADSPESNVFSVPEEADILVFYSTYEGRVAYRDTEEGSWFIQELCSELNKNGERYDLLTMLTHVNFNVATRRVRLSGIRERKQMPVIQSSLTRKFYLSEKPQFNETGIRSKLDEMHDLLLDLHTKKEKEPSPRRTVKKTVVDKDWETPLPAPMSTYSVVPEDKEMLKLKTYLDMFLNYEEKLLSEDAIDTGHIILSHLSIWKKMDNNKRKFLYEHVIKFFVRYGRKWQYFHVLNISDSQIANIQAKSKQLSGSSQSVNSDKK
ncbi:caspase-1-like [Schistocerca gregaria]|uniref:caspase-1-like n=1 Tax=Schistocerca gregaria TaxID=7010 RepID=UPI00211DBDCC|nr:caspase-1-like [Schistocerca gregaria]